MFPGGMASSDFRFSASLLLAFVADIGDTTLNFSSSAESTLTVAVSKIGFGDGMIAELAEVEVWWTPKGDDPTWPCTAGNAPLV
jgi:hypothetical protein